LISTITKEKLSDDGGPISWDDLKVLGLSGISSMPLDTVALVVVHFANVRFCF